MSAPTVVALFSGMGGLDLGAQRAGLHIERAYELDPIACGLYEKAVGAHIEQCDLKAIDIDAIPDSDGIIGGVPCQPWSSAGRNQGAASEGNLWPATLSIVAKKRPAWFVFENVPNLVQQHKQSFEAILSSLRGYGYAVEWRILNAANFGVPQTRQRVFIVGRHDGAPIVWPTPTHHKHGVPNDPKFPRWNNWYDAVTDIVPTLDTDKLPGWILKKYQPIGFFDTMPTHGAFPAQEMRHERQHRERSQPSYTIVASNHQRTRLMVDHVVYRADMRCLARFQCLPEVSLVSEYIGNAVPVPLAQAVLGQFAEGNQ